jgi:hypothetical protein
MTRIAMTTGAGHPAVVRRPVTAKLGEFDAKAGAPIRATAEANTASTPATRVLICTCCPHLYVLLPWKKPKFVPVAASRPARGSGSGLVPPATSGSWW